MADTYEAYPLSPPAALSDAPVLQDGPNPAQMPAGFSVGPNPSTTENDAIDMTDDRIPPIMNEALLSQRAEKYHFALGDNSPGKEQIDYLLRSGYEPALRDTTVQKMSLLKEEQKLDFVNQYVANRGQGNVTPDEVNFLLSLGKDVVLNPNTILEDEYAKKVMNTVNSLRSDTNFVDADHQNPAVTHGIYDWGEDNISRLESLKKLREDLDARRNQNSAGMRFMDYVAASVPFVSWYNLQNRVGAPNSFFGGNNLEEQVRQAWVLPKEEMVDKVRAAAEQIYANNPLDALTFLDAMISYSKSDVYLNNFTNMVDIATSGGLGIAKSAVKGFANGTKAMVKVAASPVTRIGDVLDASGAVKEAAQVKAAAVVKEGPDGRTATDAVGRIFNPSFITEGGSSTMSTAQLEAIVANLQKKAGVFKKDVLEAPVEIYRLSDDVLQTAIDETNRVFHYQYPHVSDKVLNVEPIVGRDKLTRTDWIANDIGDHHTRPFQSEENATMFARDLYRLPDNTYSIVPAGDGYAIRIQKAVDETLPSVREAQTAHAMTSPDAKTPDSFIHWIGKNVFGYGNLLSKEANKDRTIATYGASNLAKVGRELFSETAAKLPKDSKDAFRKFASYQRSYRDPVTGDVGKFSRSVSEFEQEWNALHGRLPTPLETESYFNYTMMSDMDLVMRNLSVLMRKNRQGLQNHTLELYPYNTKVAPNIEGKIIEALPPNLREQPYNILMWDGSPKPGTINSRYIKARAAANPKVKTEIPRGLEDINEGVRAGKFKIIQVTEDGAKAMKNPEIMGSVADHLADRRIDYVVVPQRMSKSGNIDFWQVPDKPGGHIAYTAEHYIKQPMLRHSKDGTTTYYGDKTAFGFNSREARDMFVQRMEKARQLLQAGDDKALKAYLKANLPGSLKEFKLQFKTHFDVDTPFYGVDAGVSVDKAHNLQMKFSNYRRAADDPHNLSKSLGGEFLQERGQGLSTIKNIGTESSPVWKIAEAEMEDLFSTMDRAVGTLMRGRYFDDLKIKHAETFIAEFGDLLDMGREGARRDPFTALLKGHFQESHPDKHRLVAARNFRRAYLEMLNIKDPETKASEYFKTKLVESVIPERFTGAREWATKMLDSGPQAIRSVAFSLKMGLFNPVQLWLQAQSWTSIAALEGPLTASKASGAALFMKGLSHTDGSAKMIEEMARKAAKIGWKKEHFKEAYEGFMRTGMQNVGGEVPYLDDLMSVRGTPGLLGRINQRGLMFYNTGEQFVRMSSWNAAYLNWRAANPMAKMSDKVMAELLDRARTTGGNMLSNMNASWQKGWMSVPTQFAAYQARQIDLFVGKQLTSVEKARLLAGYSIMYGIPVAAGTAVGVWPMHEEIRKELAKHNIKADDNMITHMFMEGIPSTLLSLISTTTKDGKTYKFDTDYSSRYGAGGLSLFKDLLTGDKSVLEALGGPSGSSIFTVIKSTEPFLHAFLGSFTKDEERFPLVMSDFTDFLSSASTFSQGYKAYLALNGLGYLSKNGKLLAQTDPYFGATMALWGLQPREGRDAFDTIENLRSLKSYQEQSMKEVERYMKLAFQAYADNKDEQGAAYQKRAKMAVIAGNLEPRQVSQAMQNVYSLNQTLADSVNKQWKMKNPADLKKWQDKYLTPKQDQ